MLQPEDKLLRLAVQKIKESSKDIYEEVNKVTTKLSEQKIERSSNVFKRKLTPEEIDNIIERIRYNDITGDKIKDPEFKKNAMYYILSPYRIISKVSTDSMLEQIRVYLSDVILVPEAFKEYSDIIVTSFVKAKIPAGDNVGILAAEGISTQSTQTTFNAFQTAGVNKNVSQGIQSFNEIIEATVNRKIYTCNIRFNHPISEDEILTNKTIEIVGINVGNLIKSYEIINVSDLFMVNGIKQEDPEWISIYNNTILKGLTNYKGYMCLQLILNTNIMYEHRIKPSDISTTILNHTNTNVIYSPPLINEYTGEKEIHIYIFPEIQKIREIGPIKKLEAINDFQIELFYLQNYIIPGLSTYFIKGIPSISNLYPVKIPIINTIQEEIKLTNLIPELQLKNNTIFEGYNDILVVKLNKKYMKYNGINTKMVENLILAVTDNQNQSFISLVNNYKQIIKNTIELKGFDMLVRINHIPDDLKTILKTSKIPVNYTTIRDLIKYKTIIINNDAKLFTETQKKKRSNFIKSHNEHLPKYQKISEDLKNYIPIYKETTNFEKFSEIVYAETYGEKVKTPALLKLFARSDIDYSNTVSNDYYEMLSIFGFEVTRQIILHEIVSHIKNSGSDINPKHAQLLVDYMMMNGYISPFTPKGMVQHGSGPISYATVREPLRFLKTAALHSVVDPLTSVSGSLLSGKLIRTGTGVVDVIHDISKENILLKELREKNIDSISNLDANKTSNILAELFALGSDENTQTILPHFDLPVTQVITENLPRDIIVDNHDDDNILNLLSIDPIVSDAQIEMVNDLENIPTNCSTPFLPETLNLIIPNPIETESLPEIGPISSDLLAQDGIIPETKSLATFLPPEALEDFI